MARKNLNSVQPIEITLEHGVPMASSLQVAKHFEKAHDNVLRDIREMLKKAPEAWASANFEDISIYTDLGHATRQDPAFMMTRDGFAMLAERGAGKLIMALMDIMTLLLARTQNRNEIGRSFEEVCEKNKLQ